MSKKKAKKQADEGQLELRLKDAPDRWTLALNPKGEIKLETYQMPDNAPIVGIRYDGQRVCQLGLNVSHKTTDIVLFNSLVCDFQTIPPKLREKAMQKLSFSLWEITNTDPSISDLRLSRINDIRIHTSDDYLITRFNEEADIHRQRRAYSVLERAGFKATREVLKEITKDPEIYPFMLSFIDGMRVRHEFYSHLGDLIADQEEHRKKAAKSKRYLPQLRKALQLLRESGARTSMLDTAFTKFQKGLNGLPVLSQERLTELHTAFNRKPYDTEEVSEPTLPYFSAVSLLPTTLHEKANTAYPPAIKTYRVTEPFFDLKIFFINSHTHKLFLQN